MINLRRFNNAGIEAFRDYLADLKHNPTAAIPSILEDDHYAVKISDTTVALSPKSFESRRIFAEWLDDAVEAAGADISLVDVGLWSWLSLLLFDQVCPPNTHGSRKVGAFARYVPEPSNFRRRYRHLLSAPYSIFRLHRDEPSRTNVILSGPLHQPGELAEQISARADFVSSAGAMSLATHLFIDQSTGKRRKGASGVAAARLGKLINQYRRTWDFEMLDAVEFAAALPKEFTRFVPKKAISQASA